MIEIKNKILKTELVEWKELKFIQTDTFKKLKPELFEKLKESLIENNFIENFKVWHSDDTIYCLDGFHRIKALNDIETFGHKGKFYKVPAKFPAAFIDCKDREEASRLVLIYSSQYAKIQQAGLEEFLNLNQLDLSIIKNQIEIPGIKLGELSLGKNESIETLIKNIESYKFVHLLLTFEPEIMRSLKPLLIRLQKIDGVKIDHGDRLKIIKILKDSK